MITDPKLISQYYQALLARSPEYVGIFYVGVTSTGVCCIATCRARKPKRENVVFYRHLKDVLAAGYRPCKICQPTEHAVQAPANIVAAIALAQQHPKQKIGDVQLRQQGISPEGVRRWFVKHYGMTFQAFARMYRINSALQELKAGRSTIDSALDAGYESLSGFGYTYKKILGKSPMHSTQTPLILIHRFTTLLGPMLVCATEQGVCLLEFVERRGLESEFKDLQRRLQAPIIAGENAHTRQCQQEMTEYFAGQRQQFTVALHMPGTAFQQQVWAGLLSLPYASTTSYQALAASLDQPKAIRAVAAANGANRIAIIVPCHRVLGKDGSLTGYGGGLERKRWLLEHEQA